MGCPQAARHVAEEGRDLALHPGLGEGAAGKVDGLHPGLLLHPQTNPKILADQVHGIGHEFGQELRPLAASGHEQANGRAGRLIGTTIEGRDVGADRIAHHLQPSPHPGRGLHQGRKGAGHRRRPRGEPTVDTTQNGILLMDDRGNPPRPCRQQGRQGRIAAKAHHHRRPQPGKGRARLTHAPGNTHRGPDHADHIAGPEGRRLQRQAFLGRKLLGVLIAATVRGQHDPPAAGSQRTGQRLCGKHVPAGTPGRHHGDLRGGCHGRAAPALARESDCE